MRRSRKRRVSGLVHHLDRDLLEEAGCLTGSMAESDCERGRKSAIPVQRSCVHQNGLGGVNWLLGNEANKIKKPSGKVQWWKPGCCREQHAASNAPWEKSTKTCFYINTTKTYRFSEQQATSGNSLRIARTTRSAAGFSDCSPGHRFDHWVEFTSEPQNNAIFWKEAVEEQAQVSASLCFFKLDQTRRQTNYFHTGDGCTPPH